MKKLSVKQIKEALLGGKEITLNKWSAKVNDRTDEIEVYAPDGSGRAASLMHFDISVERFVKAAGGMPSTTPKPKQVPSSPSPKSVMGPDTTDKHTKTPAGKTQPKPQGKKPSTNLGPDSSEKAPWKDPRVNVKPPMNTDGLSSPDLGKDTSGNGTNWGDKQSFKDELFGVEVNEEPEKIINEGEELPDMAEFHEPELLVDEMGLAPVVETPERSNETTQDAEEEGLSIEVSMEFEADGEDMTYDDCEDCDMEYEASAKISQEVSQQERVKDLVNELGLDQVIEGFKSFFNADQVEIDDDGDVLVDDNWAGDEDIEFAIDELQGEPWLTPTEIQRSTNPRREYNKIADTFDQEPEPGPSYMDLVNARPHEDMLRDIGDPDKWEAGQMLAAIEEIDEDDKDAGCDEKHNKKSLKQAGPRLKEDWGNEGAYTRDLEAESSEELYHLVRALGTDDDYDWSGFTPSQPNPMMDVEDPNEMSTEIMASEKVAEEDSEDDNVSTKDKEKAKDKKDKEAGEIPPQFLKGKDKEDSEEDDDKEDKKKDDKADKKAVDEDAKGYWSKYFKEYGKEMTDDDITVDRSNKDPYTPDTEETPKPAGQQSVEKKIKAQASPSPAPGPMPVEPSAEPSAPATPSAPPGPAQPAQPKPGAGDEGLKTMGFTDEEIKTMTPEVKQKILKTQKGPAQPAPGPKTPAAPSAPGQPTPPVPSTPATPAPAQPVAKRLDREAKEAAKIKRAFDMLTAQVAPVEPATPSAPAPTTPTAPATPSAPASPTAPEFDTDPAAGEGTPEVEAFKILNEIRQKSVQAETPEQVSSIKAQELVQRLLTEVGMPMSDARTALGLDKNQGFDSLFN